jgi:hypothetical protein
MVYDPTKDFLALWRNIAGVVSKTEMPGLDYVVAALARAGVVNLAVSATAPVVSQSTTAWLKAAVPSYSAEGQLFLWDKVTTVYLAATPALFLQLLEASAGENGASWWTSVGGAPLNTVGNNGDFAIRTDEPGGIYGPKAAGAWPATPIPGTTDVIGSAQLDLTFGTTPGQIIYRGATVWQSLPIGAVDTVLTSLGGLPAWDALSALLDVVFGSAQGSLLYRDAAVWNDLAPGTAGQVLSTNGPAANPAWAARTAEFSTGTNLVFYQAAAPTGWTKQTLVNDYGLRVTSGAGGVSTPGSAFSTVFAQTAVGNTTLSTATMPSHTHVMDNAAQYLFVGSGLGVGGGGAFGISNPGLATIQPSGVGGAHTHSVNLTLAYVDVIIASKN